MKSVSKKSLKNIENTFKQVISHADQLEKEFQPLIEQLHPKNKKSALNLLHYIALRHRNMESVQQQLSSMGISSLQHAESHVMANIHKVQRIIAQLASSEPEEQQEMISIMEGKNIIRENRKIFGPDPKQSGAATAGETAPAAVPSRSVHIMVTFPSEASTDYQLVRDMMEAGMTCARINCAKDDEASWAKMIENIRKAEKELDAHCKVLMDLGGPKIRTGKIRQAGKVIKLKPVYDAKGNLTKPAVLRFAAKYKKVSKNEMAVPVKKAWLSKVNKGDKVTFTDTQGHKHKVKILSVNKKGAKASLDEVAFLDENTSFTLRHKKKKVATTPIGKVPSAKQYIYLQKGDTLYIHHDDKIGEPPRYNDKGEVIHPGHIGCSLPEVFKDAKPGDPILFDDGKIRGKITETLPDKLTVAITFAKNEKRALKPDKGINLPESSLNVNGLTQKDLKDLDFVAKHADIVNLSFVRDSKDVTKLLEELKKRDAEHIGMMLKIETQHAVRNLPWLILYAMQHYPISIMLARGDLAIETGWEEMAVLQDEILWLCEAAHVPLVWATQVLEGMAKKGLPKRAEITDAAMAHQSDCVMLNKGDYMIETINMLADILQKMEKQNMKSSHLVQTLDLKEAVEKL